MSADKSTDKSTEKRKSFCDWFAEHKKGEVDLEATHELAKLIGSVQQTGKDGTLTVTIKVKSKGESQVEVTEDVKVKTPVHDRTKSIYFVDKDRGLRRDRPGTQVLPFGKPVAVGGDAE